MPRFIAALALGLTALVGGARAADSPVEGTWKLTFPGQQKITFLIMLSPTDKEWVGDYLGSSPQIEVEPKIQKVVVKDGNVSFDFVIGNATLTFDGRVAKDGKKISGSLGTRGDLFLTDLIPSKLKNLKDRFNLARETLEQSEGGQEYFDAVFGVLGQAASKKMKADDVKAIVEKAAGVAESYGPRWQRSMAMKLAAALADQEAYAAIALEQARQAEKMLKPDDEPAVQMQVLESLATTLKKTGKTDELKPIEARLTKLEARDYAEYAKKSPPFKAEEYSGRKGKSDRAVLVELFTGSEIPNAVAIDPAVDALGSTYKPTEAVLLEYHVLTQNNPDPLVNPDCQARAQALGQKLRGIPSVFVNGKRDETPGGANPANAAKARYTGYREAIEEILEKPAGAKLALSATQKGDDIDIKANVTELANPAETVSLRFALTEERIRYQGGNGLRYHHHVVRALPGGAKGFALTKKDSEHTAKVNVDELRKSLAKFLDEVSKDDESPNPDRPLALKNLKVVAFIQDDATGEVLQAAQVPVGEK